MPAPRELSIVNRPLESRVASLRLRINPEMGTFTELYFCSLCSSRDRVYTEKQEEQRIAPESDRHSRMNVLNYLADALQSEAELPPAGAKRGAPTTDDPLSHEA